MIKGLIDMHCHIVPGVDDGATDVLTAAKMMQTEYLNGVTAIIATPHYRRGMFEMQQEIVDRQFQRILRLTERSRSGLKVYLGCEYHTNPDMVNDLRRGNRPTMAGSRYVLTEFSPLHSYTIIRGQIYALVAAGYKPIIAHAERYRCFIDKPELISELLDLGAEIQLTAGNVMGDSGWRIKKFCYHALKSGQVQYVATDAHNMAERKPNLQACAVYLAKKFGRDLMEQVLVNNPEKIIIDGKEK